MKPSALIPLQRKDGTVVGHTIVDADDLELFSQWTWRLSSDGYAVRSETHNGNKKTIRLHREINQTPARLLTDHINGNKLDNRRSNLRTATASQNNANNRREKPQSGYTGVYWHNQAEKWNAQISIDGKVKGLGLFDNKEEAALAYNMAALEYRGPFARLNVIES